MATFILVHGTFVKSAEWPALQQGLEEIAVSNGQTAQIKQIPWTGKNTARAREAAAVDISRSVKRSDR
ncbi:hypothetical protein [Bradyrhizobium sp. AZCC 2230]|uniref:hypothetical protein n=1 Tax=Bradyrhizobium sp. AZCC 2230 TaxID=3117021 RepID=UPI002FF1E54E